MGYVYYQAINKEEHLLFAEEIQAILKEMGYTISIKKIHKISSKPSSESQCFYRTRAGLKKVYSLPLVIKLLREEGLFDE